MGVCGQRGDKRVEDVTPKRDGRRSLRILRWEGDLKSKNGRMVWT